jgi:hypothetical protein
LAPLAPGSGTRRSGELWYLRDCVVEEIITSLYNWVYIHTLAVVPFSCRDHPAGNMAPPSHAPRSMLMVASPGGVTLPQSPGSVVGLSAEVVKSNVSPSQVTKKLENVRMFGSHSNEPDGTIAPLFRAKSRWHYWIGNAEETVAATPVSIISRMSISASTFGALGRLPHESPIPGRGLNSSGIWP